MKNLFQKIDNLILLTQNFLESNLPTTELKIKANEVKIAASEVESAANEMNEMEIKQAITQIRIWLEQFEEAGKEVVVTTSSVADLPLGPMVRDGATIVSPGTALLRMFLKELQEIKQRLEARLAPYQQLETKVDLVKKKLAE